MEKQDYLYCYTMTHDTGFAPNPYHGVLTLATCKPLIRKCAKEGYWISGWTGNAVHNKQGEIDRNGPGRLIYLAQVSKVLGFEEYWEKYKQKRPVVCCDEDPQVNTGCGCSTVFVNNGNDHIDCGDNIYKPDDNASCGYTQLNNPFHGEEQKTHDLSGKHVLICKEFYYFGVENAVTLDGITRIPRWKKYVSKEASRIIQQVTSKYNPGLYPQPK